MALEFQKGGIENAPIVNAGEIHVPCVVLVDTSGSMSEAQQELNNGLKALVEALKEDPLAVGRVEFCIIGFGSEGRAKILVPFGPAYDYEAPCVVCDGPNTPMHGAVQLGLDELEARKQQYKVNGTGYMRPWMFLLTDGYPNDRDNGAFDRLRESQVEKHCTFFAVGVGDQVDRNLLKSLHKDGIVLTASKENFKNSFVWLSNSLSVASASIPGTKIELPDTRSYQLTVEA